MVAKKQGPRVLYTKLIRDFKENAMQFLAMALLCFLGTWVFSGLDGTWRLMENTVETYFEDCNLANIWISNSSISVQDIKSVKNIDGIRSVQERTVLTAKAVSLGDDVEVLLEANEGEVQISKPYLMSGELLRGADKSGCLIEEQFAAAHGLGIGDRITLNLLGEDISFIIRGRVLSAEHVITSKNLIPDPDHYGFIIVSHAALPSLPYTELLVDLVEDADENVVREIIENEIPSAFVITQNSHADTAQARSYSEMFHGLCFVFPVLAFAVAALIVVSSIKRMIDKERMEIGILKSYGYPTTMIRQHYLWYAIIPSTIGAVTGLLIGQITLPDVLWGMVLRRSRFPYVLRSNISWISYFLTGLSILLSVGICFGTIKNAMNEHTSELLRPKPPKSGSRLWIERWTGFWDHLSFNWKLIVRNLFRNRWRTVIIIVGIVCCNMLIISTFGLNESVSYFTRRFYGGTLSYDVRADIKPGMAGTIESYRKTLDADTVEGVMEKTVSLHSGPSAKACVITVMDDDQTIYRLSSSQTVMQLPKDGAAISQKLAHVLGIKLGDTVDLYLPGDNKPLHVKIGAFADTNIGQGLFVNRSVWKSFEKGDMVLTAILLKNPSSLCLHRLEESEAIEELKYIDNQYHDALSLMDATKTAFSIMSGTALALAFTICYNMGILNYAERLRDYATLKVLGYHGKDIGRLMLFERGVTALVGILFSIPIGVVLVTVILKLCEYDDAVFTSHVSLTSILSASVITFLFTISVECLLTAKVKKINMVEALKSVE